MSNKNICNNPIVWWYYFDKSGDKKMAKCKHCDWCSASHVEKREGRGIFDAKVWLYCILWPFRNQHNLCTNRFLSLSWAWMRKIFTRTPSDAKHKHNALKIFEFAWLRLFFFKNDYFVKIFVKFYHEYEILFFIKKLIGQWLFDLRPGP